MGILMQIARENAQIADEHGHPGEDCDSPDCGPPPDRWHGERGDGSPTVPATATEKMDTCNAVIGFDTYKRTERVRDFQPPWRTVFVYTCPECGAERRLRASGRNGSCEVMGLGAMVCGALLLETCGPEARGVRS